MSDENPPGVREAWQLAESLARGPFAAENTALIRRAEAAEAELASVREHDGEAVRMLVAAEADIKLWRARVEQLEGALRELSDMAITGLDEARALLAPITSEADQTGDTTC